MSGQAERLDMIQRYEQRVQLLVPAELGQLLPLPIFSGIPEKAREKVVDKCRKFLHFVDYAPGEVILREGEYSDSAFFIASGSVEVLLSPAVAGVDARPRPRVRTGSQSPGSGSGGAGFVGRGGAEGTVMLSEFPIDLKPGERRKLDHGEIFGEIGALTRFPVSATVRALTPARLLRIRLPGLRMLIRTSKPFKEFLDARYRERALAQQLRGVALFADLEESAFATLQQRAELASFEPGQIIAEEGTPIDTLLLVRGGYVKLSVRSGTADLAVTYLRKGDYAGEAGLLVDEAWPFSLQALEHVELVQIDRDDFKALVASQPGIEAELWEEMLSRLKLRGYVARNPISSEYVQMAMETGLIHGESVLLIDLSTCTRCDECVRGCADSHDGVPRFIREGQKYRNWLIPAACYQCTDPVCMIDCPTGAITRAVGTLEVTIQPETCIGCTNCAKRCPWDNIVMVETGEERPDGKPVELATKCDLCITRAEGPACVQMCPHESAVRISFKDMERVTSTLR